MKYLSVMVIVLSLSACVQTQTAMTAYDKGKRAFAASDYKTAFRHWKPLAEAGDRDAQYMLGAMYGKGYGFEKKETTALKWFCRAAVQGQTSAMNNIGYLYSNGQQLERDSREAIIWYLRAAGLGNAAGQLNVGVRYLRGTNVPKDVGKAYMWLVLSHKHASDLDHEAALLMSEAEEILTPDQIAAAEHAAKAWKPASFTDAMAKRIRASKACVQG